MCGYPPKNKRNPTKKEREREEHPLKTKGRNKITF
jgi:hypothetical protein